MVEIRQALESAFEGATPDGRYALEDTAFSSSWVISPDSERELSPRDLLASIHISGAQIRGGQYEITVMILLTLADYAGTRTSAGSGLEITALDRAHGAAQHAAEILMATPIPGGRIVPTDYDRPRSFGDGVWLSVVLSSILTLTRR